MLSALREEDIDGYSDAVDPPSTSREQWSRAECRQYLESGGNWKPLLDRTSGGAMLTKLGWRTRLEKALGSGRPTGMSRLALDGGVMAASEGSPQHFGRVAKALASDGFVAVNFGVYERYGEDATAIFGDADGECARLAGAMKAVVGSGSAEASIMSQQARIAAGGAFPVLHALRESLTNFVLGLRSELSKGDHRLVLTSYTDARVCCLPANESAGTPRFDRDGPSGKGGPEKRVDPSDGCSYTQQEFVDFYGPSAAQRWSAAKAPTGAEDKRKLSACLFLNENWRGADGGAVTVYAFDEAGEGSFRALQLKPEADTLLLFRSDRVVYGVEKAKRNCFSLKTEFLGHYAE